LPTLGTPFCQVDPADIFDSRGARAPTAQPRPARSFEVDLLAGYAQAQPLDLSGLQFPSFRAIKPLALLARRQQGHHFMTLELQIFAPA
jgi:hypothetical protein